MDVSYDTVGGRCGKKIFASSYFIHTLQGHSQDFSKGGSQTISSWNIVGCLLKKRLTKGESQAPQEPAPASYALALLYWMDNAMYRSYLACSLYQVNFPVFPKQSLQFLGLLLFVGFLLVPMPFLLHDAQWYLLCAVKLG